MLPMKRSRAALSLAGALVLLAGLLVQFGSSPASAQAMTSHPAHIHTGLCPTPGNVVFPLTDVSSAMAMNGTPMAGSAMMGAGSAIAVESSETTVKAALKDLADGNHSIVIHESMANIGNYLVCGDIGGMMMGPSDLAIGLGTLNNSGYTGVATLHDNGDGTTLVTLYLQSSATSRGPAATPASAGTTAASNAVSVDIKGYAFDPASLDVAVGTTVTWKNDDTVPHTVTGDGGTFGSKPLNPGDTFSYTFTAAGAFPYHCEYHANMKATVNVK